MGDLAALAALASLASLAALRGSGEAACLLDFALTKPRPHLGKAGKVGKAGKAGKTTKGPATWVSDPNVTLKLPSCTSCSLGFAKASNAQACGLTVKVTQVTKATEVTE